MHVYSSKVYMSSGKGKLSSISTKPTKLLGVLVGDRCSTSIRQLVMTRKIIKKVILAIIVDSKQTLSGG